MTKNPVRLQLSLPLDAGPWLEALLPSNELALPFYERSQVLGNHLAALIRQECSRRGVKPRVKRETLDDPPPPPPPPTRRRRGTPRRTTIEAAVPVLPRKVIKRETL